MKTYKIGLSLIFAGFIIFIIFGFLGIAKIGIFFIFPFIISNKALSIVPVLIIFIGFIILFISPFYDINKYNKENYNNYYEENYNEENNYKTKSENNQNKKSSFGGIVMIGPVPIIFGNNKKLVYVSIIIALIIIILYILFIYRFL